jgi:hypothetical protein
MKKPLKIYAGIIALLVLQSCGIVTKTRYGNGLKLNLGIRNEKENQQARNRFAKSNLKPQVSLNFPNHADIPFENLKPVSSLKIFPKNKITLKKNYKILEPSKTKKKIEPHVKIGGILFYASILGSIIMSLFPIPLLAGILGLSLLAGIVLTLVGKRFMKKNPDQFRGNGLLWSVLITCSVFLLLTFINLAFFMVAFA